MEGKGRTSLALLGRRWQSGSWPGMVKKGGRVTGGEGGIAKRKGGRGRDGNV